ncbi:MAG TPA: SIS domain-containing protein [Firmicutes bacterium]|nr:SIS domain-containing protein [Bacillota bacterium]
MSKTSRAYRDAIISLITTIEEKEQESIDKAATILAKAVAEDRLINVIGPGGHSNMAVEETFWRAGGLAPVNAMLDAGTNLIHGAKRSNYVERTPGYAKAVLDSYGITTGDVLVIVNAYGINAMTIDCALECKKRGVTSIGISSTSFANFVPKDSPARHPSGKNLYELVDVFIDNHLPLGDSIVEVEGIQQKMGPTSTFANSFTINLLMIRTAEKLLEMGIQPPVWTSANMPEGDKLNKKYEEMYFPRIKHLR